MKFIWNLVWAGCVLVLVSAGSAGNANDPPKAGNPTNIPNNAVIYWQAFSLMPALTDEERKAIDAAMNDIKAPITEDLVAILKKYELALREMQRARAVAPCIWQLDSDQGPLMLLPHLDKARPLSRAALLRARQRFATGEIDGAIRDVLSVYKLGRDCGTSPILISLLVNGAYEKLAGELLALNLPLLNKEQLDSLEASLRQLPPTSNLAAAIREEERSYVSWLTRMVDAEHAKMKDPKAGRKLLAALNANTGIELDSGLNLNPVDADGKRALESLSSLTVADVQASIQGLKADYMELATIAEMPFESRAAKVKLFYDSLSEAGKFRSHDDALRYFSAGFLSITQKALNVEEQWDIRRRLFEQAIHIQRDGGNAKPINGRDVEYRRTDSGFELKCPSNSDIVVIKVGP